MGLLVLLMMVSVLVVIMMEKVCWYYCGITDDGRDAADNG